MSIYDDLRTNTAQAETEHNQALTALAQEKSAHDADNKAKDAQIADLQAQLDSSQPTTPPTQPPTQPPTTSKNVVGGAWKSGESLPSNVTHLDVYRYYFPPGKMKSAQSWGGDEKVAHDKYGCRIFSVSFKPDALSGTPFGSASITNMTNYLKSIPSDVPRENVLVTFFHEIDDDIRKGSYTIPLYKQGSKQVADVAHSLGMKYGPIHNGVNRQNGATGAWGIWPDVWKANEADTSLYDFWGTDYYPTNYADASSTMQPIVDYAKSLGLPCLIGEIGVPKADAAKQQAWCAKARTWFLANIRWGMYWSSQVGTTGTDYRLTDASAKAWFGI